MSSYELYESQGITGNYYELIRIIRSHKELYDF